MNILMTQIGTLGDCLLTTTIARQIKEVDYPGCRLSWLIGDKSDVVLRNNPHVDEVIVLPVAYDSDSIVQARKEIAGHIKKLRDEGRDFDKVFIFDNVAGPQQASLCFGTLRKVYFRIYHELYGHRLSVSPEPVIVLEPDEIENVRLFMAKHDLDGERDYLILFESNPQSGQSQVTPQKSLELAQKLVDLFPRVKCILSGKNSSNSRHERIIDADTLAYRENAELLNHCRLMVGANSAITWLNASTWSKKIPMVQNVRADYNMGGTSVSVEMDYKAVGTSTSGLIELQDADAETLFECLRKIVETSFDEAKISYPERQIGLSNYIFGHYILLHYGTPGIQALTGSTEATDAALLLVPAHIRLLLQSMAETQRAHSRHEVNTGGRLTKIVKRAVRHMMAWLLAPICDEQTKFNSAMQKFSRGLTIAIEESRKQNWKQ